MKGRQFGRYAIKDNRDERYCMRTRRSRRDSRYWQSSWFGDQGRTSSCVGYAWAHWLEAFPHRQFLSPMGIYEHAQHIDEWEGNDYDGTSVRAGAKLLKDLGFIESYQWTWDVGELANCVLEVGPVVVGTKWHEGMNHAEEMVATGQVFGGHAYLIDGVNAVAKRFRVKNSWAGWGNRQRGWISYEQMGSLLAGDGECCLGIEKAVLE